MYVAPAAIVTLAATAATAKFPVATAATVTTAATSYEFKNLEEGAVYLYRVKASDGDASSAFSDYMEVALLSTGIDEVVADGDFICRMICISPVPTDRNTRIPAVVDFVV
jgi:hypothetical protein